MYVVHRVSLAVLTFSLIFANVLAAPPAPKKAQTTTASPSTTAVPLLRQGVEAYKLKNYSQSESAFQQALTRMGPTDPNLIVAYEYLGSLHYNQHHYQQALPWLQKTHNLTLKRSGAQSLKTADSLYIIANAYLFLKDTVKAESTYKNALSIYELPSNQAKITDTYADCLQNLASLTGNKGNYDASIQLYQKALHIKQQLKSLDTASILENMGIMYQNKNQLKEASSYYQQALSLYENQFGSNSSQAQKVYFRLQNINPNAVQNENTTAQRYDGSFYEAAKKAYQDRNYLEAAKQYEIALKQAQTFYPDEKRFISSLQSNLGKALYLSENADEAKPYLQQALAYQSKQFQANEPELLGTQTFLGLVYTTEEHYELAESTLKTVLSHTDQTKSPDVYYSLFPTLADTLCHLGKFEEGRTLYSQALAYYQQPANLDESRVKKINYQLTLLNKMFQSQSQGLQQYLQYSVNGIRHWRTDGQPIRILLTSGSHLKGWNDTYSGLAKKAFQEWQTALHDQITFEFVNDPAKTDVTFEWTDQPIKESDVDAQVGVYMSQATRGFFLKGNIIISIARNGKARTQDDIYTTNLHEIGHMLGLAHSSNLADIMSEVVDYSHTGNNWPTLSPRDIQTAQILYTQKPSVTNPKGITLTEYQAFQEQVKPGLAALQQNSYSQAYRILHEARNTFAEDPYINFYYGLSAFQKGDYKEAKEIFENFVMPEDSTVFSLDKQLGLIYVELGHQYNRWGKKNKVISDEFYTKGVQHLQIALQSSSLTQTQREYLIAKLREGQMREKPEPVYYYDFRRAGYGGFPGGRYY